MAVTVTAATFFSFGSTFGGRFTPNCLIMLATDWLVNFTWFLSPVPSRPTTRP
ncbi:hypothetical protein D3C77_626990 [compost metagenome]